ncbi:hypothetical protein GCM10010398_35350 [Streptomyces fimbriatus]
MIRLRFARPKEIVPDAHDRVVGLVLGQIAVDGAVTRAPGGGQAAGRSPADRGKQGMKRSGTTDGSGIPLGRVLIGANCHDSPLLAPTLGLSNALGPLPDESTVHLDAGCDSAESRAPLDERGLRGRIAHKGTRAPVQATQRWHAERTHAWQYAFHRLARCYARRISVICDRSLLRPRRHRHHRTKPAPTGMDQPPLGHTPPTPTMTSRPSARPLHQQGTGTVFRTCSWSTASVGESLRVEGMPMYSKRRP